MTVGCAVSLEEDINFKMGCVAGSETRSETSQIFAPDDYSAVYS